MQFYIFKFVLNRITESDKNYASRCLSTEETYTHYFRYVG